MDITTLGLAIDSRQAATAAQNLDNLADAGARAETTTGKATAAMSGDFKRLAKDVAALVETQTRQERMSQAAATAMLEMSASMRAVAANTAAASKAVDAEAIAAASARGAVAALTQALQANSDAQRKAESSARAEAAAQQAASAAAKDAATLRDSHVQAYRAQQAAADKYMASLRQEVGEFGKTRAEGVRCACAYRRDPSLQRAASIISPSRSDQRSADEWVRQSRGSLAQNHQPNDASAHSQLQNGLPLRGDNCA